MRYCDRHGVDYAIGLARNKTLEKIAGPLMLQAKAQYEQTREKQRLFTGFEYAAGTWDRERRVIHKAGHNSQGANPRLIVASLTDEGVPWRAQEIYDKRYCSRGEKENRI